MRIILNKDKCIGCGMCWSLCPRFFEEVGGKSSLRQSGSLGSEQVIEVKAVECAKDTAENCPTGAISIKS